MKWKELLAGLMVALATTVCLAEMPVPAGSRPAPAPLLSRTGLFGGQTWWTRYGQPVNSDALAENPPAVAPGDALPEPMHGDGYVYGPGSCDCSPPCIDHLWDGYYQNPKRCKPYSGLFGFGCLNCNACNTCNTCGNSCNSCRNSCGCAPSCSTKAACGCGEPVTCTQAVSACGSGKPACGTCQSQPLGHKFKSLFAHWSQPCNTCSTCNSSGTSSNSLNYGPSPDASAPAEPSPSDRPLLNQSVLKPPVPMAEAPRLISWPRLK